MWFDHLNMCPRNKQKMFSVEPTQTEAQSVSVVSRDVSRNPKIFFLFVSLFRTCIETTETNKNDSKQTEKIEKTKKHPIHLRSAAQGLIDRHVPVQHKSSRVCSIFPWTCLSKYVSLCCPWTYSVPQAGCVVLDVFYSLCCPCTCTGALQLQAV